MNVGNVGSRSALRASSMVGGLRRQQIFDADLTESLFASGKGSTTPTFTRASTAYSVDHEGFLHDVLSGEARFLGARRVRNLYSVTQSLSSGTWPKTNITNSTYTQTDPFGGTAAMKLIVDNGTVVDANNGVGGIYQTVTKTASTAQTLIVSVYAKAGETHILRFREDTSLGYRAVFNLNTGEISYEISNAQNFNAQMDNVGNGWWRCSARYTTGTGAVQQFTFKGSGAGGSTTGDGVSGLFIAFPQLEDVTGATIQAPSEYISTGVLSAPFHGANVDGVKYYNSEIQVAQNLSRSSADLLTIWAPTDATVAAAGENTPIGEPAYAITDNAVNSSHRLAMGTDVTLTGLSYTCVAYIKAGTKDTAVLRLSNSPFTQGGRLHISSISAMTSAETITGTSTMTSSMEDAGNGWRKVTINVNFPTIPTIPMYVLFYTGADANPYVGTGQTILVGSVHLRQNTPSISPTYIPTTTRAIQTVTGVYNLSSSIVKGYFAEVGSTNLLQRSAELDNASWLKTDTTVTANNIASPDGYTTAELCTEGVAGTASLNQGSGAYVANTPVTFSVYLKRGNTDWIRVTQTGTATPADSVRAWFNLATGAKGSVTVAGAATQGASEIEALNNGWYRCSVTYLPNATETTTQTYFSSATADNNSTRVNNATYYAWGAQVEALSEATSYIPTTTAPLARSSDYLFYANTGNVLDARGTIVGEFSRNSTNTVGDRRGLALNGITNDRLHMIMGQTANPGAYIVFGTGAALNNTAPSATGYGKNLIKYGVTWENGVATSLKHKVGGFAFGTSIAPAPAIVSTGIFIGGIAGNGLQHCGTVRNIRIYRVRVSDDQLTALTT